MITIIQGENATFDISLRDSDGDPFDLTNFDAFKVCLPLSNGSILEISQSANANGSVVALNGNALLGKLTVTINSADTQNLNVGDLQTFGLQIDNQSTPNPRSVNFEQSLTVQESFC